MGTINPIWTTIATERRALATDLANLTENQCNEQSLCDGWSVKDLVAHMTSTAQMNPLKFFGMFATSGFNMTKLQAKEVSRLSDGTGARVLARFEQIIDSKSAPPGPVTSWLGEAVVHAEDIRRPLGIPHKYPMEALVQVADFYKNSDMLIGTKSRIMGLHLQATDTEWSHGEGLLVEGPMLSLLMATTGRQAFAADLTGEGVDKLR